MSDSLPAVGVHPTATDRSMPIVDLAKEVEARGLAAITLPEHTHMPVDSEVLIEGWQIEERYGHTLDPYIACAFIAATTSLEVGTGVSLVAQHDAIALAKAVSTLDFLSQGRVVLGVGFGYNRREIEDHGVAVADRRLVVEETVALMRALWAEEIAEFEGQYRRVSRSWSWPKPVRSRGPLVLLGGQATRGNMERIVDWADGWLPAGIGVMNPEFARSLLDLRRQWGDAGRQATPEICCFFAPGPRDEMASELDRAAQLGVQRMQLRIEERTRDETLPILDELAAVLAR